MGKIYTVTELRDMGMDDAQINAIITTQKANAVLETQKQAQKQLQFLDTDDENKKDKVIKMQHNVEVHTESNKTLVPTSLEQIAKYKEGVVVELPPFADGQPFVARMIRPSMLGLIKSGKIPNSLLNQATSLFANGANALNGSGKNTTTANELFDVIDVIVDAALLEPTISDIRSVGMDLSDDQLMAIFSYTQKGIKALEQFRTV